jgi:hypothetical protein
MARLESQAGEPAAPPRPLKKAATVPAGLGMPAKPLTLPRGGTLVKLHSLNELGLGNYNGRMGRIVEMNGKQYMDGGKTELATVLLDCRVGDYDRGSGVWIGVPVANLRVQ